MSLILYLILGHNSHRIEEYHHSLVEQDAILVSLFKDLKSTVEGETS